MSLILEHTLEENADGCLTWDFVDSTGNYSASLVPGGYGAPNLASSAVTSATILIVPHGYTTGYTFTFTIVSNVITVAKVTDPAGVITTITEDLTSTVFPFTTADPFVIIGEWLGYGVDSQITSSTYYFEYNVTNGTDIYTSSADRVIVCQVCCCVRNAEADLDSSECSCESPTIEKVMRSQIFLDSAIWAMENGEVEKSYTNLMTAKKLCENGCSDCG